jgi:predicted N-acyltransferase
VPGRRLLAAPGQQRALLDAAIDLTQANDLSSLHLTFCTAEEAGALAGHRGTLHRMSEQYHWENPGYTSFDDFLAALSSRKRKMIRKERAVAHGHGLRIEAMTGDDLRPEHWDALWSFYQDTGSRKWGRPYLTRGFFDLLHHKMRQDVLLVLAFDGARVVAGALNLIGREALFGRYWGTLGDYPCLHFELCYYQAMDWAIAARLSRVEAGAQGEHKLARGYMPVTIHSLHWIKDQGFREAVARYLEAERREVGQEIAALAGLGPFRKGPGGG